MLYIINRKINKRKTIYLTKPPLFFHCCLEKIEGSFFMSDMSPLFIHMPLNLENTMSSTSTSQPSNVRKLLLNSRRALDNAVSGDKVRVRYKVRVETPDDSTWAFAAITNAGREYKLEGFTHDTFTFTSAVTIWRLRLLWNTIDKDLRVMIETLNFVKDYTGERYFRKYYDANTDEKKDDLAYYNSDNSDSEEEEEEEEEQEPNCLYCACDPSQEDHLSDCKSLHYNNEEYEEDKKEEKEEPSCKYCQSDPSEEGHDEDCELLQTNKRIECNKKFYGL